MKDNSNNLLISIDFRSDKGGIARVAHLIYQSLSFSHILSLHGKSLDNASEIYFNKKRMLFLLKALQIIFFARPLIIVFDHLNIARILTLIPRPFLNKVIIFLHDEEAWERVSGLRRIALSKATNILCNSTHTMQRFLKNNKEFEDKTRLCLLTGVPKTFLNQKATDKESYKDWFDNKRPYCLFVSRLWKAHRYKGYFELLEAFGQHYKNTSSPFIRLALIGNGDDAHEVQSCIEKKNLKEHVRLFSGLSDVELALFYKNSTALIFPSTREGFGFVFLEAMFFKKACIGITDQPAKEIIRNGKSGELLPDNKPETLRKVLEDIEKNPEKYKEYGEAGYVRYQEHFTNEHFKKRFLSAIAFK